MAVLFADLAGSTALADRLEAEVSYRIVSECLTSLSRAVTEAGGYVVKTLGDGLMALFGAPTAYGDDPERAARAALRCQAWMSEYASDLNARAGTRLALRIGINYGAVVAASIPAGGGSAYDVLGDVVNVAQRTESAAEPSTVCVTESFYRITRQAFEYQDRGMAFVKGKAEPLHLYRLDREREAATRARRADPLPLAGRAAQLALFREAARRASAGAGQVLAVTGEGGLGKSRLLEETALELEAEGYRCLRATGTYSTSAVPLALWRTWMHELLPVAAGMSQPEAAAAIRGALAEPEDDDASDALATLLVDPGQLLGLEPEARDRILRTSVRAFADYWRGERLGVFVVDEAPLVDSLSFELLQELARDASAGEGEPALLLVTAGRAGEGYPPKGSTPVRLDGLAWEEAEWLIERSLPEVPLPREVRERIIEQADGSPLVLDLILRAVRDSEDPAALLAALPDTVYGVIQSELDHLSPDELRVARRGSILGRSFAERWLERFCARTETRPLWPALTARELLVEQRPPPERELRFRHGALQEVLYESVLKDQRREDHAGAAACMEEEAERRPELAATVAWHWRRAEAWAPARAWTLRAADYAAGLFSGDTAEGLYRQTLEMAQEAADLATEARARAGLGTVARHAGRYADAIEQYVAAASVLEALEPTEPDLRVLRAGIGRQHASVLSRRGSHEEARPLLRDARETLNGIDSPEAIQEHSRCLAEEAHLLLELGQANEARASAARSRELAEARGFPREAAAAGDALGRVYGLQGDWAGAERELRLAAELAERCDDYQGAASCWINLGGSLQQLGRLRESADAHARGLEHARRIGDVEKVAIVAMDLGVVYLNQGRWEEARRAHEAALRQFSSMDHPLGAAAALYNLADTLRWAGETDEAAERLDQLEAALASVDSPLLQAHAAATRAEVALARGDGSQAEQAARRALAIAGEADYPAGGLIARLALGRALRLNGDEQAARKEMEAAVSGLDEAGMRLEAARARAELSAILQETGAVDEGRVLGEEAVRAIRELDAEPWLQHLPRVDGA